MATESAFQSTDSGRFGYVADGQRWTFVEAIPEGHVDEPANDNRSRTATGGEQPDGNVAELELGPNNGAANRLPGYRCEGGTARSLAPGSTSRRSTPSNSSA